MRTKSEVRSRRAEFNYAQSEMSVPREANPRGGVKLLLGVNGELVGGEGERGGDVGGEVSVVVAAGVEMEFVGDVAGGEDFVDGGGAGFEAVVVLIATIEMDFQAGESCDAGESDGAVLLPKCGIEGAAEDSTEDAGAGRGRSGGHERRDFVDECGAVGADGREELRMVEGQMKRAEAAHGDAIDGAIRAAWRDAVALFDKGKEFLDQEIFVAVLAILGIDVETCAAVGCSDQEIL
jgi:hypothetical protein